MIYLLLIVLVIYLGNRGIDACFLMAATGFTFNYPLMSFYAIAFYSEDFQILDVHVGAAIAMTICILIPIVVGLKVIPSRVLGKVPQDLNTPPLWHAL